MSTAFSVVSPLVVYNSDGGGYIEFYQSGTTTLQDVYSDSALTISLGSRVNMNSAGRTGTTVFGSGSYRVRVYADDSTLIAEDDPVELAGAGGLSIPSLVNGEFLTNNGSVMSWDEIRQLPDMTGHAGDALATDGANVIFKAFPKDGTNGQNADITVTDTQFVAGDGGTSQDKFILQTGSGTLPASNAKSSSVNITFPTAFKKLMFAIAIPTTTSGSVLGQPQIATVSSSTTGFTAAGNVVAHGGGSNTDANITTDVPFDWFAVGTVAP